MMSKNDQIIDGQTGEVFSENEIQSLQKIENQGIVRPIVNPEQALQAWKEYQDLVSKVLDESDYQIINHVKFKKKSGWRKLAGFFNLSTECHSEKEIHGEGGVIAFDVIYKAVAPNGRSASGDGSCDSHETEDRNGRVLVKSRHDTRSTAHTRAFNRAVSNLIGGGEVSADEIRREEKSSFKGKVVTQVGALGGGFTFTFGKYNGKRFADLNYGDLAKYIDWMAGENYNKYKPIIDAFEKFSREITTAAPPKQKTAPTGEVPEMPDYMKEEIIPF